MTHGFVAFTPEQDRLRQETLEFARREIDQRGAETTRGTVDWRPAWQACGRQGILGLIVPTVHGGQGRDVATAIAMLEAFGQGCGDNGLALAVNGQIWAVQEPILSFGSAAQKAAYLPGLASGELVGAHGMTEPESGSDAMSLRTRADRRDGGYVLSGRKTYIGMGPACDVAVVFASTAPDRGSWGLSAFIVEAGDAGFTRGPEQPKAGLQSVPMGELHFGECWIPEDRRIGPEGAGASIFQSTMLWERSFIFSSHVGAMQRQLDDCVAFARSREVFGQPVSRFQSVSNRLAEMKLRLETARLMLHRSAAMMDAGTADLATAALTKLHLSEAFLASSLDAVRIHGGAGYLGGAASEVDLRDSLGGVIYSGTSDIQREVISRLLERK